MKADGFVHQPADEVTPGEKLNVCVKFIDLETNKLGACVVTVEANLLFSVASLSGRPASILHPPPQL
jgi:hypothetical protein